MSAVLLDTAVTVSVCVSLVAPVLIPLNAMSVFAKLTSSATLVMGFSVGGSFEAVTTRTKLVVLVARPSETRRVIKLVPTRSGKGVMASVRLELLPLITRLLAATRFRLVPVAATLRLSSRVSESLMISGTLSVVSSVMV